MKGLIVLLSILMSFSALADKKTLYKQDLYAVLGIDEKASELEIRRAYKKLQLRFHPDRVKTSSVADKEISQKIQEAYAVLSNTEKRNEYDSFRRVVPNITRAHAYTYAVDFSKDPFIFDDIYRSNINRYADLIEQDHRIINMKDVINDYAFGLSETLRAPLKHKFNTTLLGMISSSAVVTFFATPEIAQSLFITGNALFAFKKMKTSLDVREGFLNVVVGLHNELIGEDKKNRMVGALHFTDIMLEVLARNLNEYEVERNKLLAIQIARFIETAGMYRKDFILGLLYRYSNGHLKRFNSSHFEIIANSSINGKQLFTEAIDDLDKMMDNGKQTKAINKLVKIQEIFEKADTRFHKVFANKASNHCLELVQGLARLFKSN